MKKALRKLRRTPAQREGNESEIEFRLAAGRQLISTVLFASGSVLDSERSCLFDDPSEIWNTLSEVLTCVVGRKLGDSHPCGAVKRNILTV